MKLGVRAWYNNGSIFARITFQNGAEQSLSRARARESKLSNSSRLRVSKLALKKYSVYHHR